MAQSHLQGAFAPRKEEIDTTTSDTIVHQPKGAGTTSPENGSGIPTLVASPSHEAHEVSPVLERDAQTKGSWTAYVKTKQFWIAMLLGQSKLHSSVAIQTDVVY